MCELVVSRSGGTVLRVSNGCWVLAGPKGEKPIAQVLYGLLPLLERSAPQVLETIASADAPAFPVEALLVTALGSDSSYWQERAIDWFVELDPQRSEPLVAAARRALDLKLASQSARHRLRRWLEGKSPTRR